VAAPAPQPATPAARTHTVVAGDSLSRISQRYYGTPGRWQDIYRANQDQLRNANSLPIGLVLQLP
jgi:nucleoid-associated protein YgaU